MITSSQTAPPVAVLEEVHLVQDHETDPSRPGASA